MFSERPSTLLIEPEPGAYVIILVILSKLTSVVFEMYILVLKKLMFDTLVPEPSLEILKVKASSAPQNASLVVDVIFTGLLTVRLNNELSSNPCTSITSPLWTLSLNWPSVT